MIGPDLTRLKNIYFKMDGKLVVDHFWTFESMPNPILKGSGISFRDAGIILGVGFVKKLTLFC